MYLINGHNCFENFENEVVVLSQLVPPPILLDDVRPVLHNHFLGGDPELVGVVHVGQHEQVKHTLLTQRTYQRVLARFLKSWQVVSIRSRQKIVGFGVKVFHLAGVNVGDDILNGVAFHVNNVELPSLVFVHTTVEQGSEVTRPRRKNVAMARKVFVPAHNLKVRELFITEKAFKVFGKLTKSINLRGRHKGSFRREDFGDSFFLSLDTDFHEKLHPASSQHLGFVLSDHGMAEECIEPVVVIHGSELIVAEAKSSKPAVFTFPLTCSHSGATHELTVGRHLPVVFRHEEYGDLPFVPRDVSVWVKVKMPFAVSDGESVCFDLLAGLAFVHLDLHVVNGPRDGVLLQLLPACEEHSHGSTPITSLLAGAGHLPIKEGCNVLILL